MALTKIKYIPIVIVPHLGYITTRSKHGGKWRDRRREKHCQFSLSGMNTMRAHNTNMKPQAKILIFSKLSPKRNNS